MKKRTVVLSRYSISAILVAFMSATMLVTPIAAIAQTPTGTVVLNATLNGVQWNGNITFSYSYPLGSGSATVAFPNSYSNQPTGQYTLGYQSGGPAGAALQGIFPAATQTLIGGGTTIFTFAFVSPTPTPTPTPTPSPTPTPTPTYAILGIAGSVVSVDVANNSFNARVTAAFGFIPGRGAAGLVFPAGRVVTIKLLPTTQLMRFPGQPITLGQVLTGAAFSGNVQLDLATLAITASRATFFY